MSDPLGAELWAAVAADLRRHRVRGLAGVVTADALRFVTAAALVDHGADPTGFRVEELGSGQVELAVGGTLLVFSRGRRPAAGEPGQLEVHLGPDEPAGRCDHRLAAGGDLWLTVRAGGRAEPEAGDPEDGYLQDGEQVDGLADLQDLLHWWLGDSDRPTIGRVPPYGGRPLLHVRLGRDRFVLNADTKREAVRDFIGAAVRAGGAERLRWWVVANQNGRVNLVTFRADPTPVRGWYAYAAEQAGPRELG